MAPAVYGLSDSANRSKCDNRLDQDQIQHQDSQKYDRDNLLRCVKTLLLKPETRGFMNELIEKTTVNNSGWQMDMNNQSPLDRCYNLEQLKNYETTPSHTMMMVNNYEQQYSINNNNYFTSASSSSSASSPSTSTEHQNKIIYNFANKTIDLYDLFDLLPSFRDDKDLNALSYGWQITLGVIYSLTAITSFLLNAITVIVLSKCQRSELRKYLISLSMSDLLMSCFSIPFTYTEYLLGSWIFPPFLCPVNKFVVTLSVFVSVATMIVIGINRHSAIMHPLKRKDQTKIRHWRVRETHVILGIWLLGIAISSPEYLMFRTEPFCYNQQLLFRCRDVWQNSIAEFYTIFIYLATFVIPLFLLSFLYIRIALKLWHHKMPGNENANRDSTMQMQRTKVVKMLFVVVIVFIVSWLPIQTFALVNLIMWKFMEQIEYRSIGYYVVTTTYFICHWLSMAHSCLNPLIYGFMSKKFRRDVQSYICGSCGGGAGGRNNKSKQSEYTGGWFEARTCASTGGAIGAGGGGAGGSGFRASSRRSPMQRAATTTSAIERQTTVHHRHVNGSAICLVEEDQQHQQQYQQTHHDKDHQKKQEQKQEQQQLDQDQERLTTTGPPEKSPPPPAETIKRQQHQDDDDDGNEKGLTEAENEIGAVPANRRPSGHPAGAEEGKSVGEGEEVVMVVTYGDNNKTSGVCCNDDDDQAAYDDGQRQQQQAQASNHELRDKRDQKQQQQQQQLANKTTAATASRHHHQASGIVQAPFRRCDESFVMVEFHGARGQENKCTSQLRSGSIELPLNAGGTVAATAAALANSHDKPTLSARLSCCETKVVHTLHEVDEEEEESMIENDEETDEDDDRSHNGQDLESRKMTIKQHGCNFVIYKKPNTTGSNNNNNNNNNNNDPSSQINDCVTLAGSATPHAANV